MWAHGFDTADEVNKFRVDVNGSNDPGSSIPGSGNCRWISNDGIRATGCLELFTPGGGHCNTSWWRPFSALPGDRGYTSGPAWDPNDTGMARNWAVGLYGHSEYHASYPGRFAGTSFYLQFRTKISSSRFGAGNPEGGKLVYIDTPYGSNQEIVIQSLRDRRFRMYSDFGAVNGYLGDPQGDRTAYSPPYPQSIEQPGGAYNATCIYGSLSGTNCWVYPADEWVTVLIKITPGHETVAYAGMYTGGARYDNGIEVWVARAGQTSYTKIWQKLNYVFNFDSGGPVGSAPGWNVMKCSAYMNNVSSAVGWSHRFDEIIFSTQFIACPQA